MENEEYENPDEILPPDPEAWVEQKRKRELARREEQLAIKDEYMADIYQSMRRASNNGYLSYRDMVPLLREIFDDQEIEVMKMLL